MRDEKSIDECTECGGWLGVMEDVVFDGTLADCDSCGRTWAAAAYDGSIVWMAHDEDEDPTPTAEETGR